MNLFYDLMRIKYLTQQIIGIDILQSNYDLCLKNVILNGILYALLFYNAVVSYSSDNPVGRSRMGQKQIDGEEMGHAFDPENRTPVLTVSISLPWSY